MKCVRVSLPLVSAAFSIMANLCLSFGAHAAVEDTMPIRLRPPVSGAISKRFTIEQAVATATTNYPQILQRLEQVEAARSAVTLQKLREYTPDALATWEDVAATHNKLTQILFGNPVLPPNPGPGLDPEKQTFHGSFFSGSGFLFDWTPLDFGLHRARITESKATLTQVRSHLVVTQLDVAENAAMSFLAVVTLQEQVRAQEANVHRMQIVRDTVRGLVESGLKPGVDLSIADAQLADSRNGLIEATQQLKISYARLAAAVGEPDVLVEIDPQPVEQKTQPPVLTVTLPDYSAHPLALAQRSAIGVLQAHNTVISKSNYPVIHWLGGMNFRGAGLDTKGHWQAKDAYGLLPTVTNWNVGVMATWNFLDWVKNHQELKVQAHRIASEQYGYRQIIQNLSEQNREATAMIEGAVALAENAPIQVHAATDAELRARTRYETGLANIAEVAEAERLLTRAQVQMAIARVGVWKALLAYSNTRGSINPFLQQIASARQEGM